MNFSSTETKYLYNKVKLSLTSLGLNERYSAFEHLAFILVYLIQQKTDSSKAYSQAIKIISDKNNVDKLCITSGLKKLTDSCKNFNINYLTRFNLNNHTTLNRIRVIKLYTLENLNTEIA